MNPDCHFGDHRYKRNGWCRDCDTFNGGLLQFARFENAERAGTLIWHGDPEDETGAHYHFSEKAATRCSASGAAKEGPE